MPAHPTADFRQERIFLRRAADTEIGSIRVDEALGFHPLSCETLVIVNRREVTPRRLLIEEQRHGLAAPPDAVVELGISLDELAGPRLQIGTTKIEVTHPRVQELIGFRKGLDGFASFSAFQRD